MKSPDIRRFFQAKESDREPLFELQPDTTTKIEIFPEKNPGKNMNKPCPKRKKKSLSTENTPCPRSKKARSDSVDSINTSPPIVSPKKNMKLKTVFTTQDLLTSSSEESPLPSSRELSPESLGPKEFSDESDVEVETSDGRATVESQDKGPGSNPGQAELISDEKDKNDDTTESVDTEEEWEVDEIKDYKWCRATTQGMYLVSWIGWETPKYDTWETLANLTSCGEKLREFYTKRVTEREAAPSAQKRNFEVPPDPRTNFERRNEFADTICPPPCQSELEAFFHRLNTHPVKEWKEVVINQCFDKVQKSKAPNQKLKQQLKEQIMLKHVLSKKKEQQERLKEWAAEINAIDAGHAKIAVENTADLEGPPRQMKYINQSKPAEGILIPDDPPFGCECPGGMCDLKTEKTCCPRNNDIQDFPYSKYGKLRITTGVPIYECNKRCQCSKDCSNRVVQKGRKVKLCIYRTENGCGWGVKTLENIKKGTFVVEYVGEVISNEEAEERGRKYDAEGRTYLFDLDFNKGQEDNPYTVDAAHYGNVAHFINHSCDPNLATFNVWIDCLDPDLPRIAFFTVRDIVKGEQLTFDYKQRTGAEDTESESEEDNTGEAMECRCGSSNCRKIMFC